MSDAPPPGWGQPQQPQQPQGPPPGYPQGPPPQFPQGAPPPQFPQGAPPPQFPQGAPPPPGYPQGPPPQFPQGGPPPQQPPGWGQPPGQGGPPPGGGGRGNGLVIGLVIGALVLLGIIGALVVLRASDDEPVASGTPTAAATVTEAPPTDPAPTGASPADPAPTATAAPPAESDQSVFDLQVGTCFNDPGSADEIQTVGAVPCEGPHDNEVFALVQHPAGPADPYPGREVLAQFGEEQCQGQLFADYVGTEYQFSRYFASQLTPTDRSWEQGDREVICLLFDSTTQLTESVRGSGR